MTAKQMIERVKALSGTRALEGVVGEGPERRTRVQIYSEIVTELEDMKPSDKLTKARQGEIEKALGLGNAPAETEAQEV